MSLRSTKQSIYFKFKLPHFHSVRNDNYHLGGWCNGNTTVFGTVTGGSIPSLPELRNYSSHELGFFCCFKNHPSCKTARMGGINIFLLLYSKNFLYFLINSSKLATSSSSVLLFRCFLWHFSHSNKIFIVQLARKYSVGYILPWQVVFLSPGISPSTCNEVKQWGQWFLHVFAAIGIGSQQFMQLNVSFIFFMKSFYTK